MTIADTQRAAHFLAARRISDFGLAPCVLHHADVADPDAVRETRAHGLDDGFLGGEPHGDESLGPLRPAELRTLGRHEQAVDEMIAKPPQDLLDARGLEHVDADAEDHRRAPIMSAFMSRTAASRPVKMARAMMQWPMLSSTISEMAATGPTLL